MDYPNSPLNRQHLEQIDKQLSELSSIKGDIQRAAAAGIDCGERGNVCDQLSTQLRALRSTYFPNVPG